METHNSHSIPEDRPDIPLEDTEESSIPPPTPCSPPIESSIDAGKAVTEVSDPKSSETEKEVLDGQPESDPQTGQTRNGVEPTPSSVREGPSTEHELGDTLIHTEKEQTGGIPKSASPETAPSLSLTQIHSHNEVVCKAPSPDESEKLLSNENDDGSNEETARESEKNYLDGEDQEDCEPAAKRLCQRKEKSVVDFIYEVIHWYPTIFDEILDSLPEYEWLQIRQCNSRLQRRVDCKMSKLKVFNVDKFAMDLDEDPVGAVEDFLTFITEKDEGKYAKNVLQKMVGLPALKPDRFGDKFQNLRMVRLWINSIFQLNHFRQLLKLNPEMEEIQIYTKSVREEAYFSTNHPPINYANPPEKNIAGQYYRLRIPILRPECAENLKKLKRISLPGYENLEFLITDLRILSESKNIEAIELGQFQDPESAAATNLCREIVRFKKLTKFAVGIWDLNHFEAILREESDLETLIVDDKRCYIGGPSIHLPICEMKNLKNLIFNPAFDLKFFSFSSLASLRNLNLRQFLLEHATEFLSVIINDSLPNLEVLQMTLMCYNEVKRVEIGIKRPLLHLGLNFELIQHPVKLVFMCSSPFGDNLKTLKITGDYYNLDCGPRNLRKGILEGCPKLETLDVTGFANSPTLAGLSKKMELPALKNLRYSHDVKDCERVCVMFSKVGKFWKFVKDI